jgi:hypothetical protein
MQLIIDGHNLIPQMPGINLSDPDDEMRLIEQLQVYCRERRANVDVFFDGAPAGMAPVRMFGKVRAHFVRAGTTADAAIIAYLNKLGKQAKNVVVVSSDREVKTAARSLHAQVMSSVAFAQAWKRMRMEESQTDLDDEDLSDAEIRYWEEIFKKGK